MKVVLTTCQPVLFKIWRRTEAIMVLPGGSRHGQVPATVSISNRIKANCHLPLTLPPKKGVTDNQVCFWYTLSTKATLERRISTSYHPSLVRQKTIFTVLVMASWFSQLAVCHCHRLWLTLVLLVFTCLNDWWCPLGLWHCQQRLSVVVGRHKTWYKRVRPCTSSFIERLCYF